MPVQRLAGIGQVDDRPSSRQAWGAQPPSHEHDTHVLTPIQQLQPAGQGTWLCESLLTQATHVCISCHLLISSCTSYLCLSILCRRVPRVSHKQHPDVAIRPLGEPDLKGIQHALQCGRQAESSVAVPAVALQVLDEPAMKGERRVLQHAAWAARCKHFPVRSLPECARAFSDMCAAQPEPLELDRDCACRGVTTACH